MHKLFFTYLLATCLLASNANAIMFNTDTTTAAVLKKASVELINKETPIILRKGETLVVKIADTDKIKSTVRIHSSLGKLIKEFVEVENQITMITDKLMPGVYLIIIKQNDKREVRKFLLTD